MTSFSIGLSNFEPDVKHSFEARRPNQSYLMPTRSNTPEELSPSKFSFDSFSDKESIPDFLTLTTEPEERFSSNGSLDAIDSPTIFEIDVRPKRRKFTNLNERIQFVEEYKRKYKTEMCKNWELRGTCKFGDKCCFAHGKHELKGKSLTHFKYKTKPCKQYHQTGYCPYGQRCQYLHKEALSPNIFFCPSEDKTKQNSYTYDMLHEVHSICSSDADLHVLFHSLPERSRLNVFATMAIANS